MDTSSIALGGILTLLCLSPFIMEMVRLRKRNQTIKQLTKDLDSTGQVQLKQVDQIKSIIMGWDPRIHKLLFYRKSEHEKPLWLDLSAFNQAALELKRSGHSKSDPITEIILELKGNQLQQRLCLFDQIKDESLGGEIQLGRVWLERLQQYFKST